jgi:High-affinity nickel-transport protein
MLALEFAMDDRPIWFGNPPVALLLARVLIKQRLQAASPSSSGRGQVRAAAEIFLAASRTVEAATPTRTAMSLGTAITVSTLVVLAVSAKDLALRLAGADSPAAERAVRTLEIAAALFVMLFGLTLFGGALAAGLP